MRHGFAPDTTPEFRAPFNMCWVETSYGGFWIKYKMFKKSGIFGDSAVDLEFPGRVSHFELLKRQFARDLKRLGAILVKTGGSVAFRISVPRIVPPHFDELRFDRL